MIYNLKNFPYYLVLLVILFNACEQKRQALGADNEIRVICSELDKKVLEGALTFIFDDTIHTPQPEPYYYLKFSKPDTYNDLKKQAYIVVGAINRNSENLGLKLIKKLLPENQFNSSNTNEQILFTKDLYASNQLFMVINSDSVNKLIATAKEKKEWIKKQFHDQFIRRQKKFLFGDDTNTDLEKKIKKEYDWNIQIPWGWEIIRSRPDSNFVWIGREIPFQWISIHSKKGKYVNNELVAGKYLWDWPKNHYMSIEFNNYNFRLKNTKFKDHIAWRVDGVWQTIKESDAKGGPFRSYLFYDEKSHQTFHINMLIYNPGNDKSIYLRQLDLIANTFEIEISNK
ncbi:MAG: hypothetical protein CMG74_09895 [Candidatus Marinimicrobia bacterium]|nr:hypothetical protein [Candidatus Neomarinimicrobiota bacterium]|tara:strand:- start:9273 stop:10298 length:1026 start_codon:yes stop_codon:yes gene_type:complete